MRIWEAQKHTDYGSGSLVIRIAIYSSNNLEVLSFTYVRYQLRKKIYIQIMNKFCEKVCLRCHVFVPRVHIEELEFPLHLLLLWTGAQRGQGHRLKLIPQPKSIHHQPLIMDAYPYLHLHEYRQIT